MGKNKVAEPPFGLWPPASALASGGLSWLRKPQVATTLLLAAGLLYFTYAAARRRGGAGAAAGVARSFVRECGGVVVGVFLWLTPQFIDLPGYEQWIAAGAMMVLGDYLCGGPHVNPAVSYAFVVMGDVPVQTGAMFVAAQMAGGVVAFPLLAACLRPYGLDFGAPAMPAGMSTQDAAWNEFMATFCLMAAVFVLCTTRLGPYYIVRQPMVAVAIRMICINFGATGPAMNPMLPTCFALLKTGTFPTDLDFYVVYWAAPAVGAAAAALGWSLLWTSGVFAPSRVPIAAKKSKSD